MKRRLLVLLAVAVALFAIMGLFKSLNSDKEEAFDRALGADSERQRLVSFWRYYQDATTARTGGDFAGAARLYEKALTLEPGHEDSIYYLGNCFFETGDYIRAAGQYRRIIRMNPHSQRAFSQLGVTLSTLAPAAPFNPAGAEESFRKSLAINREESGPFLRLGLLALTTGDLATALQHFRTAAGFRSPEGYFQAGSILFGQNRYREAAGMFKEVLRMNAREKAISGRGVLSEGDIVSSRKMLTPLEAAGVKALLYLAWTTERLNGDRAGVDEDLGVRLNRSTTPGATLLRVSIYDGPIARAGDTGFGDFDRDGDQDLAVVFPEGAIRLYRNAVGELKDTGMVMNLAESGGQSHLACGDYDGDGRVDLFAAVGGMLRPPAFALYRNMGREFRDVSAEVGLTGRRTTLHIWVGDLDLDGRPDLLEAGCPDSAVPPVRFYRNVAGRGFREVSREAGLVLEGSATDCLVEDFNSDKLPDLVVLRWKLPPLLFLARKGGQFARAVPLTQTPMEGYSCLAADFNRDSHPDLLLTAYAPYELAAQNLVSPDLAWPVNTPHLLLGDGQGGFREVTNEVGLDRCSGVMQAAAADLDGDGWIDLVFANGGYEPNRLEPSVVLRNENGKRFRRLAYLPDIRQPGRAFAVNILDMDGDGRSEVWLAGVGVFEMSN